jgi:excisionase family DNA binding protein
VLPVATVAVVGDPAGTRVSAFRIDLPEDALGEIAARVAAILAAQQRPALHRWMTIEEAAEHARCKPQRIYDLRSGGRLSKTGDGGRALVDREELDRLIEAGGV